jgi:hypothetical protein
MEQQQKTARVAILLLFLVAAGGAALTYEKRSQADTAFQRPEQKAASVSEARLTEDCLRAHRSSLKDPFSVRALASSISLDSRSYGSYIVTVDARAKNSFGAFSPVTLKCRGTADRMKPLDYK